MASNDSIRYIEHPEPPEGDQGIGLSTEMGPIITALKEGNIMTRYYSKRAPDLRIFSLKLEEFQIAWSRTGGGKDINRIEGCVKIREISEVRRGQGSRDFEKNPDLTRKLDPNCCFVVFYGNEFKLKTLSLVARSHKEREYWVKGLVFLMYESLVATQPVLTYRWLLREWNTLTANSTQKKKIGMREMKAFFQKANVKMSNTRIKELLQNIDRSAQIDFEQFKRIYHEIMCTKELTSKFSSYIENGTYVPLKKFQKFLLEEQQEVAARDINSVREYMLEYLSDNSRNYTDPYFTVSEFLDFLFSRGNSAFNSAHCSVYQDMNKPINCYWIASSHNTYLTGDQFQGESSVEAYVRCLRMGCRCLELDCWDGPDGQPIITHGHTLVSKIKFLDVVRQIKENAFVASDFPLILSLENHCSLSQQRFMAQAFKDIFGEYLLSQPIDNGKELPSPDALKNKIILKHKKLPKDPNQVTNTDQTFDALSEDDLSHSFNGYLLLEDEIDHSWKKHFFCLTVKNKMFWTEEQTVLEEDDDDDGLLEGVGVGEKDELHYGEKWFHGKLPDGRKKAEQYLNQFNRGDGSFLVRESTTFVGDFSLSFWRRGKVQHCRIRSKQENGQTKYYLVEQVTFDSLYSLVNYYQSHAMRSNNFEMILTDAIPQPNAHLDKDWYHDNLTRSTAEDMLKRVRRNGAFLVRRREKDERTGEESYAISFRAEGKIKHCKLKREGRLFTIGTAQFESLVELVEFYMKHPLYKGMKLKYAINEQVLSVVGQIPEEEAIYGTSEVYHEPNSFVTKPACRALWDYEGINEQEMTFCRGAFITNVVKDDSGWWTGDYGDQKQKLFPANYCEEIITPEAPEEAVDESNQEKDSKVLGDLQKGAIDVQGCSVEMPPPRGGQRHLVRIVKHGQTLLEAAAETPEELSEWLVKLQEAVACAPEEKENMRKQSIRQNISPELSDLIVYCQPVPFDIDNYSGKHYEMSSFPETKADRYINKKCSKEFVRYHRKQISRVYPKGSRIDSSNYDPVMMWNCGVQLCALNYQTPDRAMQLNHGRFLDNGRCGYVLMPDNLRQDNFCPHDRDTSGVEPLTLTLTVFGCRHLVKSGRGIASPFVEVEVVGAPYDCAKFRTETKVDNGLNPAWFMTFEVDVLNPPLAFVRFVLFDEDMFGEPNFIGHAIFPMGSLRTGYRSLPLKNAYSEEYEMSSLLVHFDIRSAKGDDENLYATIQGLRDRVHEISYQMATEEKMAREAMTQMSQRSGPLSLEAQEIRNRHVLHMETLGRQLQDNQSNLQKLQKERAARYID
ncbi:1-phosphatidylinositol 4,5-bisphosphate phosphodiesterase gamma-1-like isoform X2 [Actinia tenebrosa]|uniref:Phosphoinositide phospholipase C n=1 Tax=Actinia tenebrosa TaxID=6105 RepID=A0A6P8I673_ACTTE|nr:1-phosphatidylinositol 4,5-bisphosphate phosphodiesterase gamma-1-like isoform X2 [Actinia tenebrosa]XP_031560508.1 1-phosphatidylinositol 4,5-bisphosphate phosphodiesterase gamma-1-like isoform X2 [Actinia tenebrosa]